MSRGATLGWFSPPELSRLDHTRRARALWVVSWGFLAVVAVLLTIAVLVEPDTLARRATTITAVASLVIVLHLVSRAGRPSLASWMLVIGLSVIVTQRAWITGGIHAPVAVFYALFIVAGGVLIGARGAIVTAAVCVLGAVVLTVGTSFGWLVARPGAGPPLGAFVFVILAIGMALVLDSLVTHLSRPGGLGGDAVQMLVHDMKSPIQVLTARLEMLRQEVAGEGLEDIEAAMESAATLNRMTHTLLDVGRLEAGRMPVRRSTIDLSVVADSVVDAMRILQPTRDIAVEVRGDAACSCDPELIRRVLENLVSNALKHTPIQGRVRVILSGSPVRARIAVSDEGPGVPQEKRVSVFHPYSGEGLQTLTGYESSGLGLAFCRLAVEAHGGTIRIEGVQPHGSEFIVDLPR